MIAGITIINGSKIKNSFYELKSTYITSLTETVGCMVKGDRRN